MNAKIVILWVVVVFLILTNGASGYYLYKFNKEIKEKNATIKEYEEGAKSEVDSTTSKTDDTWQRVTKENDFTFKYPAEWYVKYGADKGILDFINDPKDIPTWYNPPSETESITRSQVLNFYTMDKVTVDDSNNEVNTDSEKVFDDYIDYTYVQSHGEFVYKLDEQKDLKINGLKTKKLVGTAPEGLFGPSKFVTYLIFDSTNKRIILFNKTFNDYAGSLDKYADLLQDIDTTVKSFQLI